jgi:hypothetical protein
MFSVRPLVTTGPSTNRVDIVFMGDGYTESEIATQYNADMWNLLDHMFDGTLNSEPFGRYRNFFNVTAIDVISRDSGADHPESNYYVDTPLGASYGFQESGRTFLYVDETLALRFCRRLWRTLTSVIPTCAWSSSTTPSTAAPR